MVPCIKKKALCILFLIALLFVPLAIAADPVVNEANLYKAPEGSDLNNDLFSALSVQTEIYNQNFDKVPVLFQRLVGSEQIAVRIKLDNDQMLYATFLMSGGKVINFYKYDTSVDPYSKFEPSIIIETDEQTVRKILSSNDPLREAVNGMNEGTFNVQTDGFFRDLELRLVRELYSA